MMNILEQLASWRNADHEDNIKLSRHEVIELLKIFERMEDALNTVSLALQEYDDPPR